MNRFTAGDRGACDRKRQSKRTPHVMDDDGGCGEEEEEEENSREEQMQGEKAGQRRDEIRW